MKLKPQLSSGPKGLCELCFLGGLCEKLRISRQALDPRTWVTNARNPTGSLWLTIARLVA